MDMDFKTVPFICKEIVKYFNSSAQKGFILH